MGFLFRTSNMKVSAGFAACLLVVFLFVQLTTAAQEDEDRRARSARGNLFRGCDWCKKVVNKKCSKILRFEKRSCMWRCYIVVRASYNDPECAKKRTNDPFCAECKNLAARNLCTTNKRRERKCFIFCKSPIKMCKA